MALLKAVKPTLRESPLLRSRHEILLEALRLPFQLAHLIAQLLVLAPQRSASESASVRHTGDARLT